MTSSAYAGYGAEDNCCECGKPGEDGGGVLAEPDCGADGYKCFEYGANICTEHWAEDFYCDVRCAAPYQKNGGSPTWRYDPYGDTTQPCSHNCETWKPCCVTEGLRCVQETSGSGSGSGDGMRRLNDFETEALPGISGVALGSPPAPESPRTWSWEAVGTTIVSLFGTAEDLTAGSVQTGSGGPVLPHGEITADPPMFAVSPDGDDERHSQSVWGKMDGYGYMYGHGRADHPDQDYPSDEPSGEASDDSHRVRRRLLHTRDHRRPPSSPPPPPNGHQVRGGGCLYGSRNGRRGKICNDPPCNQFACKTFTLQCAKDTYLDYTEQEQCKAECGETHGRRRMQEAHEEATGIAPVSDPKHIHLVNKMLKAVHHGHGRRALMQSQRSQDEVTSARAGSVLGVLGGVGTAVSGRLLAGEEPEKILSSGYTLEVQQFDTTSSPLGSAAVGGGQVQVPAGENLTAGDSSIQTISWQANPYSAVGGSQTAEDPASVLSSQVFSVRLMAGTGEVNVAGLSETFNVTLQRTVSGAVAAAGPNGTNFSSVPDAPMCTSFSCINSYDVAHGSGSCALVMNSRGYTCEEHFCADCELAGFCDLSCDASCNTTDVDSSVDNSTADLSSSEHNFLAPLPNCTLDPSPSCTYWDVAAMRWRTDGIVLNVTETTVTCAFHHLTDFSAMMSPPAQTSELASLVDTFDLAAFALANPVGLVISVTLFLCVVGVTSLSIRRLRKERVSKVRHKIKTDIIKRGGKYEEYGSKFQAWQDDAMAFGDRVDRMLPLRLRSDYLCGSLFMPLNGEPFDHWQRLLVTLMVCLCTLMVNVFFFQSKHDQLEMCEGPVVDGRPSNCTGDVSQQTLCHCRTYDCSAPGCDSCGRCDSMDNCALSCPIVQSSRIIQTFVTLLLTWPIGSLLQSVFKWLHKPYVKMVEEELKLAREADTQARTKRGHKHTGGRRRYGRKGKDGANTSEANSDLVGDEGSQVWTESNSGQEEARMEEEAAEMFKEDWEKEPILPDGRLPCAECGERQMFPIDTIMRYDYLVLETRLAAWTPAPGDRKRQPTYETILELYSKKELCCILHRHNIPYSYKKNGGQNLQQSKNVMAWQVHRMVDSNVTKSGTNLAAVANAKRSRRTQSMRDLHKRVFTPKEGTNWEHAMGALKLVNPGRSIVNQRKKKGKWTSTEASGPGKREQKRHERCPVCKGTGASALVWYVTENIGAHKSTFMKVTPAQRRMAQKSMKKKLKRKQKKRGLSKAEAKAMAEKEAKDLRSLQLDDIADRREKKCGQWDYALPYILGLVVGLTCVVTIARVVRNFSAPRTVEWALSSVVSLVLSWTLTDPLKIVLLTPKKAWKSHKKVEVRARNKSTAHGKLQGAIFMFGGMGPMSSMQNNRGRVDKFKKAARTVEHITAALDAKQRQVLKKAVRTQEKAQRLDLAERHEKEAKELEQNSSAASGPSASVVNLVQLRAQMKHKHTDEKQRLDEKMKVMDEDLHSVLNGQHEKFQNSTVSDNDNKLSAETLMANYNAEAQKLHGPTGADTQQKRKDQEALQTKIAQKRRQMAERVASVEKLLNVHSRAVDESVAEKAAKAKTREDEVAAMKDKLSEATAKMERVLWTNRHVTDKAVAAFGNQGSAAVSSSAVADKFKRSLTDDVKARKTGFTLALNNDGSAEVNSAAATQAMQTAIDVTDDAADAGVLEKVNAAQRWKNLMAWQARVTALDRLASIPSGPMDFANLAKTAAAAKVPKAPPRPSLGSAVTFSAAKDQASRISSPSPPAVPRGASSGAMPRAPPRPSAVLSAQGPGADARPSPAHRSLVNPAGGPKTAEEKVADEVAIRASIARARAKLAAKKRLMAKRAFEKKDTAGITM